MYERRRAIGRRTIRLSGCFVFVLGSFWLGACGPTNGPPGVDDSQTPGGAATDPGEIEVREQHDDEGNLKTRMEGRTDADDNFIPHGKSTIYWPNGQKKTELHYINGLRHGPKTSWYQSGQMWSSGSFADGKEDGVWTVWFPNGRKAQEYHFDHGAWHGMFTEWHLNGQKKTEVEFVNGMRQGTMTTWDDQGQIVRQTEYIDGVEQP